MSYIWVIYTTNETNETTNDNETVMKLWFTSLNQKKAFYNEWCLWGITYPYLSTSSIILITPTPSWFDHLKKIVYYAYIYFRKILLRSPHLGKNLSQVIFFNYCFKHVLYIQYVRYITIYLNIISWGISFVINYILFIILYARDLTLYLHITLWIFKSSCYRFIFWCTCIVIMHCNV